MALAEASVKIVPDTSGFASQLEGDVKKALKGVDDAVENTTDDIQKNFKDAGKGAEKAAQGIGDEFRKLGNIIGGAALAKGVVDFAKSSIKAASDLGESVNAVQVTFGDLSDEILAFSKDSATSFGLASSDFNSFAVRFAGFTKQIATDTKNAAVVTEELTTRIADFASVMNLDLNEAATVFGSTLAGESEAIRRFGIDMSAASVEAYALSNGLISSKDEMTASIKVQAIYGKLMQDTAQVAGDFANTSDSLANRQRILAAEFKNMQVEIGNALVPALEGALAAVGPLVTGFAALPPELRNTLAVIGLMSTASFGATRALVGMAESAKLSTGIISGLKVGMAALNAVMIAFALYQQQEANNAKALQKVMAFLTTATEDQIDAQKENIRIMMDLQGLSPEEAFRKLAEESLGAAQRLVEAGEAQDLFGISTSAANAIIDENIRAQQQAAADAARTADAIEANANAYDDGKDAMREYVAGLGFVVDESGNVEASQENMSLAVDLAKERFDNAVQAVEDYEASLSDAFDAARSSIDTGFAFVEAQNASTEALAKYAKEAKNSKTSQQELDAIARETAQTLLDQADKAVANAEALAAMNGESLTTKQRQDIMLESLTAFRDELDPASPLAQYINGFIETLGTIPAEIPVEMIAEVAVAQKEFEAFKAAALEIGNQITIGILRALAPLSPEFKKILDRMLYEAGRDLSFNIRINVTASGQSYVTTPYGSMPVSTSSNATTNVGAKLSSNPRTLADLNGVLSFADGGIFDQPQFGLFAEAGAEAIIPLTRPTRALELMRESGLLGLAQQSLSSQSRSSSAVNIESANFYNGTDANLVAQKVNAAEKARSFST